MLENQLLRWSTFAFLVWIGVWVITGKIRTYSISGFRFYLMTGLMAGLPFIVLAVIFLFSPKASLLSFVFLMLISRLGLSWGEDQEEKAEEKDPEKWKAWKERYSSFPLIEKLFL